MGKVEAAVRRALSPGARLVTPVKAAPFSVAEIDGDGIVMLLAERWWTRLSWHCLEGVVPFLSGRGWVPIGSQYATKGASGTLDGYLKACVKRATAGWVAAVLEVAAIVEIDRGRPTKVRLRVQ